MKLKYFFLSLLIAAFALQASAQSAAQREKLLELSAQFKIKSQTEKAEAVRVATEKGWAIRTEDPDGRITELMRLNENGMPMYYTTYNAEGAALINSDKLYPGGAAGLNLSGAGQTLGEWDGGGVLTTHQELVGRVTQKDTPAGLHWHSTHVAGTLIASGVWDVAKGMSYGANLSAYDWDDDESEMASEAAGGMKVSQHSYGRITGWHKDGDDWYWYGNTSISETEDYNWGFYDDLAKAWDVIAHNAPNYVIVKSAGNDRGEGPASGAFHYYWNGAAWIGSNTARDLDGGATGYDCIGHRGVGKNILTVGAVTAASAMSSFSGWGPTDDGRIKPDIVAKGVNVISCNSSAVDSYASSSGTSMSGPMVSGSIGLLLEHQENLHPGVSLRSATIKGLIIHSGNDLGNAGPDYIYGWGLMNTEAAAKIMTDQAASPVHIYENTLNDLQSLNMQLKAKGGEPLKATIVWNDVPGTPVAPALDPTDLMLVNDLDMRVTAADATVSFPYILDPGNPATAATTGDNFRDNIEVIYIASPTDGEIYDLQITHKGSLSGGSQDYTLIVTGNEAFDYTYLFNAADNAGNYGGNWTDGSNQGSGFGAWEFLPGTGGGNYIGGTGLGDPTFGIYSGGGGAEDYFTARRELGGAIPVGTSIGLQMGYTGVDNGGEIGISFFSQGSFRFVIKFIGGGSEWQLNDGGSDFETSIPWAGNTPLSIILTRGTDNKYSIQMNQGGDSYVGTDYVANSGSFAIDRIEIYSTKQGNGQNVGFNDLTVVSDLDQIPANVDAIVKGNLTFDADLVLDNLTIESGNSVTVAPLKKLTVNTNIDNQAG
ncbi:MAG: S8 family serine peptidase, partial [Bacteroidales bacterium]|nr:S8 family serine peptidase [Bacteroidales bacterium]